MRLFSWKLSGFTIVELLVSLVVIGALGLLILSQLSDRNRMAFAQMTGTLSNARQLHLATQTMTIDTKDAKGEGMEWTMLASHGKVTPVSLAAYFDALTKDNYLSKSDLRKLTTAPGIGPAENEPTAHNICFKVFPVSEESPSDQPFVITANWSPMGLESGAPYGRKGFVIFAKGGNGGIYRQPADVKSAKLFPSGSSYNYSTLQ